MLQEKLLFYGLRAKSKARCCDFHSFDLVRNAKFLHQELPVRVAHIIRMMDQDQVPVLSATPSWQRLKARNGATFDLLLQSSMPNDTDSALEFCSQLRDIEDRVHLNNEDIAEAVMHVQQRINGTHYMNTTAPAEFKPLEKASRRALVQGFSDTQHFLNLLYSEQFGIELLLGHYLSGAQQHGHDEHDMCGMLHKRCNPETIIQTAANDVRHLVKMHFGTVPQIEVLGNGTELPYVPAVIYAVFFELLKNSARAVIENMQGVSELPPVQVVVGNCENSEMIIKVGDQGGGVADNSALAHLGSFVFSTSSARVWSTTGGRMRRLPRYWEAVPGFTSGHSMRYTAGLPNKRVGFPSGHGVPMSKLWLEALGSDIEWVSLPGHGTDVFVKLRSVNNSTEELGI